MIQHLFSTRIFKVIAMVVLVAFLSSIPIESGYAQLVQPGQMVLPSASFSPVIMQGLRVDVKDPFNFSFVMSDGKEALSQEDKKDEYLKLIKYFMASLITPNTDMWVNLSPTESDRIIPDNFIKTEMGRDLLAQDYLLKQFTSSLMYPEDQSGKEFWERLYAKVFEKYGTTEIPVDTFNKVWITADKADIYQKDNTAFVVKSHLKVMLEQDFMTIGSNESRFAGITNQGIKSSSRAIAADVMRDVIIPLIEKEVNEGSNFSKVRQVYHSMILASWFKKTLKNSLLGQVYVDQNKVNGIELYEPQAKEQIYQQYLDAYKTGVFNYIREEVDEATQEVLPRKYFSGGVNFDNDNAMSVDASEADAKQALKEAGPLSVVDTAMKTSGGKDFKLPRLTQQERSWISGNDSASKEKLAALKARIEQEKLLKGLIYKAKFDRKRSYLRFTMSKQERVRLENLQAMNKAERTQARQEKIALKEAEKESKKEAFQQAKEEATKVTAQVVALSQERSDLLVQQANEKEVRALRVELEPWISGLYEFETKANASADVIAILKDILFGESLQEIKPTAFDNFEAGVRLLQDKKDTSGYRGEFQRRIDLVIERARAMKASVQATALGVAPQALGLAETPAAALEPVTTPMPALAPILTTLAVTSAATPAPVSVPVATVSTPAPAVEAASSTSTVTPASMASEVAKAIQPSAASESEKASLFKRLKDSWSASALRKTLLVMALVVVGVFSFFHFTEVNKPEALPATVPAITQTVAVVNNAGIDEVQQAVDQISKVTQQTPETVVQAQDNDTTTGGVFVLSDGERLANKKALKDELSKELSEIDGALGELSKKQKEMNNEIGSNNESMDTLANNIKIQENQIKEAAANPVKEVSPEERINSAQQEIDRLNALGKSPVGQGKGEMPVTVGGGINYNVPLSAYPFGTVKGEDMIFYLNSDLPGGVMAETYQIVAGLGRPAQEGTRSSLGMYLGIGRLGGIGAELYNYALLHPNRYQTKLWFTDESTLVAFVKTLTVNWTPVEVANQENVLERKNAYGVGLFDSIRALPGFFDRITGKYITPVWKFLGNVDNRFPFEDMGCVMEYGEYQLLFEYMAGEKPLAQEDLVFLETFSVTDANTIYVPNNDDGYDVEHKGSYDFDSDDLVFEGLKNAGQTSSLFSGFEKLSERSTVRTLQKLLKNRDLHTMINVDSFTTPLDSQARQLLERASRGDTLSELEYDRLNRALLEKALPKGVRLHKIAHYKGKVQGDMVKLLGGKKDHSRGVFTSASFITPGFMEQEKKDPNAGLNMGETIIVKPLISKTGLENEILFANGKTKDGQKVLGVLRHPITGEIIKLITDPTDLFKLVKAESGTFFHVKDIGAAFSSEEKQAGADKKYVPKSRLREAVSTVGDFFGDEVTRPWNKVRNMFGMPVTVSDLKGDINLNNRPDSNNPDLAKKLDDAVKGYVFEAGQELKDLNAAGEKTAGWLRYLDGTSEVTDSTDSYKPIRYLKDHQLKMIGATRVDGGIEIKIYGETHQFSDNILVQLPEGGKKLGVFDPSLQTQKKWLQMTEKANELLKARQVSLDQKAGISINVKTGAQTPVDNLDGFISARYAGPGIVGQKLTVKSVDPFLAVGKDMVGKTFLLKDGEQVTVTASMDGETLEVDSELVTVDGRMMVKLDNNKNVANILELGRPSLENSRLVNETLLAGGAEVQNEKTGKVTVYSNQNSTGDQRDREIKANIKTVSELVQLMAANRIKMVPVDEKPGVERMMELDQANPMNQAFSPELADTLEQFYAKNVLVIWRGPVGQEMSQWVSIKSVQSGENRDLLLGAKEISQKDVDGKTSARCVFMLDGQSKIVSAADIDNFLKENWMVITEGHDFKGFVSLEQLKDYTTYEKVRLLTDSVEIQGAGGIILGRLWLHPDMTKSTVEIIVGEESHIFDRTGFVSLANPGKLIGKVLMKNSFEVNGKRVKVMEHRNVSGAFESASGIVVANDKDEDANVSAEDAKLLGKPYVQFFPTLFKNGFPAEGAAIVGSPEGDRNIYSFTVELDANGEAKYNIDTSKASSGSAVKSADFSISEQSLKELGLEGVGFFLAEERGPITKEDAKGSLKRIFIIDMRTKTEIGTVNLLNYTYGASGKKYYEAAVYAKEGYFSSFLLDSKEENGKTTLSLKKKLSFAENQAAINLSGLETMVGKLSGKLEESIKTIAAEIGISNFNSIEFIPSLKTNIANGQNVFYRIKGDPFSRVIVFQSTIDPNNSLFMVNTKFDGVTPKEAYERTLLGEFNYLATSDRRFNQSELETRLNLGRVSDFEKFNQGLSYQHFNEFIQVMTYRLVNGIDDETVKDLMLVRYVAAGDPLTLDLVKSEQGGTRVRFMKYDDPLTLGERPLTVVSGEIGIWVPKEGSGFVTRETEWVGHDVKGQKYLYKSKYEHNSDGVKAHPNVLFDYYYMTGVIAERYPDKDYVFYALNGTPLLNNSTELRFWEFFGAKPKGPSLEKNKTTFFVRTMERDGVVLRLVQEQNISGATQKKNLMSTLFADDVPVAVKKDKQINLSVFLNKKKDVVRNGVLGAVARSFSPGVGFKIEVLDMNGKTVSLNVKDIIEEMEATPNLQTIQDTQNSKKEIKTVNVDVAKVNEMVNKGTKVPLYNSWIQDYLLNPIMLALPAIATFLLTSLSIFKSRKGKIKMSAPRLSDLKRFENKQWGQKEALLPQGTAEKWAIFIATNKAVVVKEYQKDRKDKKDKGYVKDNQKKVAGNKFKAMLEATGGFFTDKDITGLVNLFESGKVSFDENKQDPENDLSLLPKDFNLKWVMGSGKGYESDALPIVALRYIFNKNKWIDEKKLVELKDRVLENTSWKQDVGAQWTQLLSLVQAELFSRAIKGEDGATLEMTFPDPEVGMYKALIKQGYGNLEGDDNIHAYVQDVKNGANEKQRVESYVREKVLSPMIRQVYSQIPDLGTSMLDLRKEPLENAVMSEFYRFAMINPSILPDAQKRAVTENQKDGQKIKTVSFSTEALDVVFNPNIVMKYSEPSTFREKVVYHLLLMPLSETKGISLGPVAAIPTLAIFMTRFLIRGLSAVEQGGLKTSKEDVVKEFANHMRFWRSVFAINNWSGLFGGLNVPGLFKRITDPAKAQPDLRIKELLHDEYMYYFFERLLEQEDKGNTDIYDNIMDGIKRNDVLLRERLQKANMYLNDTTTNPYKQANEEKDLQKKKDYLSRLDRWKAEVSGLLDKKEWTAQDESLAMALSADSLYWELMTLDPANTKRDVESFVHGSFEQVLGEILRQNKEFRLERNSYAYFVNELTGTLNGETQMWLFRRIIPKIAMLWGGWLLRKELGTVEFKEREFNETVTAVNLVKALKANIQREGLKKKLSGKDPIKAVNELLEERDLYKDTGMQKDFPKVKKLIEDLKVLGLNKDQIRSLNRQLIEENYSVEAPKGPRFIKKDGKPSYKLQSSLEHYFGIKNKTVRYGVVGARVLGTLAAIGLVLTGGSAGMVVFVLSLAWSLPQRLFGITKVPSEKLLWISHWAIGTGSVALFAELLFGKLLGLPLMAAGTYVTGGLLLFLIPATLMTGYFVVRFVKSTNVYQNRIWNKYWLARTIGWWSWLSIRPIKNLSWVKINFEGKFFGDMLVRILKVQRERGPILPAGRLVQDKLMDDFNKLAKHKLLSPDELRALLASVKFAAYYQNKINEKDPEWKDLVKAARNYEEALKALGMSSLPVGMSDRALVARKRPYVMVTPKEGKAREFMYTNFQNIVLKKPVEDVFARMQSVSTHEQSYNEVATFPIENYGRLGTANIAGSREFLPKLRKEFLGFLLSPIKIKVLVEFIGNEKIREAAFDAIQKEYLAGEGIINFKKLDEEFKSLLKSAPKDLSKVEGVLKGFLKEVAGKEAKLVSSYAVGVYPFTTDKILGNAKDSKAFNEEELAWIKNRLGDAKKQKELMETSLLGYSLRVNPAMKANMLASLKEQVRDGKEYTSQDRDAMLTFEVLINKMEETDDVTARFQEWAKGLSSAVVMAAEEALGAFMNEFLPNNISMVNDISEDVFNVHLTAASAYGDIEYYNKALDMFRQYGSLAFAAEKTTDQDFKTKFKAYQRSAKLKTAGMLQYGVIWGSNKEFRLVAKYENPADFDPQVTGNKDVKNLTWDDNFEYKYVSKAFEVIWGQDKGGYLFVEKDKDNEGLTGLIDALTSAGIPAKDLEALNKLLQEKDMLARFETVAVDQKIKDLIEQHKQEALEGDSLIRFNRTLLEVLYPNKCPKKFTQAQAKAKQNIDVLINLKTKLLAILKAQPGVKIVDSLDGKRKVAFVKEMRDFSKAFLKFREENYADILSLPNGGAAGLFSDVFEIMKYVEESARSEALIPFYDKRTDDIIPGNKNGGLNLNAWMNYGRSWNMDAAVRGYLGQSLYRLNYAAMVGRNPEIVIVNPAFRIWASTNNAFPGVRMYKIAQETFTQDVQRGIENLTTFYGKGGVLQPAGNAFFTTPGEDTANFIMGMSQYPDLVSTHEDWMVWEWGRPSLHKESIAGSEQRYSANVTRYEMDTGLFEMYLNPDVGYDVKLTNDHLFNHYLFASLSAALLILLPGLQGFSGFAYLRPAIIFIPLALFSMEAINLLNFFRHWRQEGSVALMLFNGLKDIVEGFPYYVHMNTLFTKARLLATNEVFKFIATVKTMIFGHLDRETRYKNQGNLAWVGYKTKALENTLKITGTVGVTLGTALNVLSGLSILSPNLLWLGFVIVGVGLLTVWLGDIVEYQQKTKDGVVQGAIPVPFDNINGFAGIASWVACLFFTTTIGPAITVLYLLASVALLTGSNVFDVFTDQVKDKDGNVINLRIKGQNRWAMFSDNRGPVITFMAALGTTIAFAFIPIPVGIVASLPFIKIGINIVLYGVMFESIRRGAFSNISEAARFTRNDIARYREEVKAERVERARWAKAQREKKEEMKKATNQVDKAEVVVDKAEDFDKDIAKKLVVLQEGIKVATEKSTTLEDQIVALQTAIAALDQPVASNDVTDDMLKVAEDNTLTEAKEKTAALYKEWQSFVAVEEKLTEEQPALLAQQEQTIDLVMREQVQKPKETGGIDMSDENLTINIKVDGDGIPLSVEWQDPSIVNVDGLVPVINSISPLTTTNVPVLGELLQPSGFPR